MEIEKDIMLNRLNMIFEAKRLESYQFWPFGEKDKCSTIKLAEAGFFWTGTKDEPDSAQCFVCNKSLDGWESTDDPWEEHKKHAPQCLFVTFGKKEDDLLFEQYYNLWRAMAKNLTSGAIDEYNKKFVAKVDDKRQILMGALKQIRKYS